MSTIGNGMRMSRRVMAPTLGAILVAGVALAVAGPAQAACSVTPTLMTEILGDARKQNLTLDMSVTSSGFLIVNILLDCNGDGDTTDPEDRDVVTDGTLGFDLRLGGNDTITLRYKAGTYTDVFPTRGSQRVVVTSGPGTNRLTVETEAAILTKAELVVDVIGGAGADTVNLLLGQLTVGASGAPGSVVIRADLGAGNDALNVTLPTLLASGFEAHAVLGAGNNSVSVQQAAGTFLDTSSSFTLDVDGGPAIDTVKAAFAGELRGNSRATVTADLAAGNDVFAGSLDVGSFSVAPSAGLRIKAKGGAGVDTLTLTHSGALVGGNPKTIGGFLEAELLGGAGNDSIKVDHTNGAFRINGTLRLALDGSAGNDAVSMALATASGGADARVYDLSLTGGVGNDTLKFGLFEGSNTFSPNNYGPAGTVLADGGPGVDTCVLTGGTIPIPEGRSEMFRKCER